MAFAFIVDRNFEEGPTPTDGGWDSETDTANQLDIVSYKTLATLPWSTCSPYRGAYCLRATLSGGTADAYLVEGDINIAANTTNYFRFYVWFSPNFTGTADDTCNIFEGLASTTVEFAFGFRIVALTDVINFGIGEVAPTSFTGEAIERGVWYCVELTVDIDNAGANDGTIDLYLTREGSPTATTVAATQVSSLDQGAVTTGSLGIQNHLSTTTGTILIDEFIQDDARIYPISRRFDDTMVMTKSGHAFVGKGTVDNITLLSGAGTDNVLNVYDTDSGNTDDFTNSVVELKNTANNETVDPAGMPVNIVRGAYVSLSGTNPRAVVKMKNQNMSSATIRNAGRN